MTTAGYVTAVSGMVLLLAGGSLGYPELTALGLGAVVALAVALVWRLGTPRLAVSRTVEPQRVEDGSVARSRLTVTNRRRRRTLPTVAHQVVAGRRILVALPSLAGGQSVTVTHDLPAYRRGRHVLPPPSLGYSDPFRLVRTDVPAGRGTALWVYPRRHRVVALPDGGSRDVDGAVVSLLPTGGIAFHSLREYRPGDDGRLIHWASTARTQTLMVKHNVLPQAVPHLVVLDTSAFGYAEAEDFEHAVRFAASWCVASVRDGHPLRLATTGGRTALHPAAGGAREEPVAVLNLLAEVAVSRGDSGLEALGALMPADRSTAVGVVTGRPGTPRLARLPLVRSCVATLSLARIDSPDAVARRGGVLEVSAATSTVLAARWNELVAR